MWYDPIMRLTKQDKKFIRCTLLEYADENIEEIINEGYNASTRVNDQQRYCSQYERTGFV